MGTCKGVLVEYWYGT